MKKDSFWKNLWCKWLIWAVPSLAINPIRMIFWSTFKWTFFNQWLENRGSSNKIAMFMHLSLCRKRDSVGICFTFEGIMRQRIPFNPWPKVPWQNETNWSIECTPGYWNSMFVLLTLSGPPLFKFGFNPSLIDGVLNVLPYEQAS